MRVLSMFDGISCGRVALDRVGITPEVYFASEIDEYAERVSADNWPDLVRLGDANGVDGWDLGRIDLLLGGSPCTNWSITKKEGRELTASGTGWELFSFYVKALQKFEPKYFLYENVKSMSPAIREEITRALGVEPILINSGLVSAQNRERLYWTNIQGIGQPEDKGIALGDILEHGRTWIKKAYTLRASHGPHGGPSSVLRSIKTPGKFSFNGVVEGGEEDIAALNEQLAKVEEGKEAFSETVAEMETDFSDQMEELVRDLDDAIQDMDLSDDAYQIGENNMQGLIDGTASKKAELVRKYAEMGRAALAAYKREVEQASPSKKFNEAGRFDIQGIIKGAEAEKANLAETYADAGRTALSAMEKSLPSSVEEPPASAAINRQTAAIVAAVRGRDGGGPGGIAIHVDKLEVRDDSDVERIARELYYLAERESRSRGGGSL